MEPLIEDGHVIDDELVLEHLKECLFTFLSGRVNAKLKKFMQQEL